MCHTRKNAPNFEKCATLEKSATIKKRHAWKIAAHLEKCKTLKKVRLTWKIKTNPPQPPQKCATLGKNALNWRKCATL